MDSGVAASATSPPMKNYSPQCEEELAKDEPSNDEEHNWIASVVSQNRPIGRGQDIENDGGTSVIVSSVLTEENKQQVLTLDRLGWSLPPDREADRDSTRNRGG
jgi:hypothetical protein